MKKINIMLGVLIMAFAFILPTQSATSGTTKLKTTADFEASTFFKKQILVSKDAWDLRTGGRNNSFSFKDSENPYSSFGVELITKDHEVIQISIDWNGESIYQPAKITPKKIEHLTDLALFWGIGKQSKEIIDYAKSQQSKRYRGGMNEAPWKTLGQISIHCGTVGETLWVGWKLKTSTAATKSIGVKIGTPADTVLELRGKAISSRQVGYDENGLLVEWEYPDVTYLMGRRVQNGIEAYRVIKITPRR
jgi:hypothetical protein